jgi:micrococcal nuclease
VKKIVFFLLLLIFSCAAPDDYSRIKVIQVIDGDTVRLANGKLLRYIGIDTPEIKIKKHNHFTYAPQPYALEAKKINKQLVENKFVRVEFDIQKTDVYGRVLGYCFVDDIFVNAKLLEDGFAVLYTVPPNVKYADTFVKMQRKAREAKNGLWGAYETITAEEASRHLNQIRTVKGQVKRIRQTKRCVVLGFGDSQKGGFTAVIFKNSLALFYDKGIDPLVYYKGKIVEVTGKIKQYYGPEIIVNAPADIQIIDEK